MTVSDSFGNQYEGQFIVLRLVHASATSLIVKKEVVEIFGQSTDEYACSNCKTTIKSVTFEEGSKLEIIKACSFYQCSNLNEIDLSKCNSLKTIGEYAFSKCKNLSVVKFPSSLNVISQYAFSETAIINVTIPKAVNNIYRNAFASIACFNEPFFEEGSELKELPYYVFAYGGIKRISLPRGLETISAPTFEAVKSLSEINANGNNNFKVINKALCSADGKELIYCPPSIGDETYYVSEGIEKICVEGFSYSRAKKIVLPSSLKSIKHLAFSSSLIESIEIPDSVTSISYTSFAYCYNLKNVTLSNSLTSLPDRLFLCCTSLETIVIPESVRKIGDSCFQSCTNLKSVVLPSNITSLGGGAFAQIDHLNISFAPGSPLSIDSQYLILSDSGTKVSQYIGNDELANITVPEAITTIGQSAFLKKTNLNTVKFASDCTLTKISKYAFSNCINLMSIELPKNLQYIENEAFLGCTSLTSIHFHNGMKQIGSSAFRGCSHLESVVFDNPESSAANARKSLEESSLTIGKQCFQGCNSIATIKLCEGIVSVDESFALGCSRLTSIEFPTTLTSIGMNSFQSSGLTNVTFKDTSSLSTIGQRAFYGATYLSQIELPSNIETIETKAFSGTSLKTIELPSSVTKLSAYCFMDCPELTSVTAQSSSMLSKIDDGVFQNCPKLATIEFNNGYYKTKNGVLFNFMETSIVVFPPASKTMILVIPSSVTNIAPYAFYACKSIGIVTIPDDSKLETIGTNAFAECKNLISINLPISVKNVYSDAFVGCKRLSCGLIIANTSFTYRNNLMNVAKMPRKSVFDCSLAMSKANCNKYRTFMDKSIFVVILIS